MDFPKYPLVLDLKSVWLIKYRRYFLSQATPLPYSLFQECRPVVLRDLPFGRIAFIKPLDVDIAIYNCKKIPARFASIILLLLKEYSRGMAGNNSQ